MPEAFVVTPATRLGSPNVVGEQITVLAPGSRTGGCEIFRQVGPEGSGPPRHCHPWDESFYVTAATSHSASATKTSSPNRGLSCICRPARCIGSVTAGAAQR
jgi:hypothetical protein